MSPSKILTTILACLLLVGCLTDNFPAPAGTPADQEQISVREIKAADKNFLLAVIDPTVYQLKIIGNAPAPDSKNIQKIHLENESLLSFNGSFFDRDFQPLGLLVSDGALIFPLTKSDLMNGIFTINRKGQPRLFGLEEFQQAQRDLLPEINFAIQSGPVLIDGQGQRAVDRKNSKVAGRTAIGLDKNNNIIVIVLRQSLLDQNNALSLADFADLVLTNKEFSDLGIHSLINLDGGNSSGLAGSKEYYPELEKVQNIIITLKRNRS